MVSGSLLSHHDDEVIVDCEIRREISADPSSHIARIFHFVYIYNRCGGIC